jgi:sirohydrochlorin cobaltochelatase
MTSVQNSTFSDRPSPFLSQLLAEGKNLIGEILLGGDFSLRHCADGDLEVSQLKRYHDPKAAREIARYDQEGNYRPLKTAPSLRRGWLLQLKDIEEMSLALDFFYPAAVTLYAAWLDESLQITSLRETLDRQTGMYRVTQKLTNDQAASLIGQCCSSEGGCLRRVLWDIESDHPIETLPEEKRRVSSSPEEIPLLCREACNLLVAAARKVVKRSEVTSSSP